MHCNQELCNNGYPYGPYYNCTPPVQCGGGYPEIIGEGDITSVVLPDGTVQFLFNPSMECRSRYQFYPSNVNTNCSPYMNPNTGLWLIRSIANPKPPSTYNPGYPQYEPQRHFNTHNNGFHVKFHNDNCTSTSDIHYFYPSLRRYECYARAPSKVCAAVQVEVPLTENKIHHYICTKPCNCVSVPMHCCETECSQCSNMSIDSRSNDSLNRSSHRESKSKRKYTSRDRRKLSKKVICECEKSLKSSTIDKSVTTYADNASNCDPVGVRETHTCCDPVPVITVKKVLKGSQVQTEQWRPKTPRSKKLMENAPVNKMIAISSTCSSNCSCRSDTE